MGYPNPLGASSSRKHTRQILVFPSQLAPSACHGMRRICLATSPTHSHTQSSPPLLTQLYITYLVDLRPFRQSFQCQPGTLRDHPFRTRKHTHITSAELPLTLLDVLRCPVSPASTHTALDLALQATGSRGLAPRYSTSDTVPLAA